MCGFVYEFFKSDIKEIKDNLEYDKKNDVFLLSKLGDNIDVFDIDNYFIIQNKKKYTPDMNNEIWCKFGLIAYNFVKKKEKVDLEDGIYYKSVKV